MSIVLPVSNTMSGLASGKSGDMENNMCWNSDFETCLKALGSMLDKPKSQKNASMEAFLQPEIGMQFLLNQFPELKEEINNLKIPFGEEGNGPADTSDSKGLLPTLAEPTGIDSALMSPKLDSSDQVVLKEPSAYGLVAVEEVGLTAKMPEGAELLPTNQGGINIAEPAAKNLNLQREVARPMSVGNQPLVEELTIKTGNQARASAGFHEGMENHAGKNPMEVNQLISLESERMRGTKNPEPSPGNTRISEGEAALGTVGKAGSEPVLLNREIISEKPVSSKQMIEQVIKSMEHMPLSRSSDVTIKLEPQSLGKLHIHLQIRDDVIVATFSTENQLAKQLLESGLGNLRMQLESSGIRLERAEVNVDLGNEWGFAGSDFSENNQSPHRFYSTTGYEPNLIMTKMSMDEWVEEEAPVSYSGDATVNYLI